jgi:GDP-mannose transporter
MLCSATLLIANKAAMLFVPAPSFVLLSQVAGTAIAVKASAMLGWIECDALQMDKIRAFSPVCMIFVATIFLNMKALQYANVETFMVARFSTPLAISVADYLFMGRQLPDRTSVFALFGLLGGGIGYTLTDEGFEIKGYFFCAMWYLIFCIDQIYLKHVADTVKMESNWGRVFYSNLLSCGPLLALSVASWEVSAVESATSLGVLLILVTVLLGCGMSYFAWAARSAVSATSFTVIGNVCKILTMVINMFAWNHHASEIGICFLLLSFGGTYFYKQAPLRQPVHKIESRDDESLLDVPAPNPGCGQHQADQLQNTELQTLRSTTAGTAGTAAILGASPTG